MAGALKKTISLPPDLARETEQQAEAEGKTLRGDPRNAACRVRHKAHAYSSENHHLLRSKAARLSQAIQYRRSQVGQKRSLN